MTAFRFPVQGLRALQGLEWQLSGFSFTGVLSREFLTPNT
jgi:hypothetical protein